MELSELTWPAVDALDRNTPIVFPIAALEQHGRHLPVFTDSMLLGEILKRIKTTPLANKLLFAPLQWLGNSHHHLDFPGTLSASPRLYLDLIRDLAENMMAHGFRRIVFLNGHGGNTGPSQQALFELRQKHRERKDLLLLSLTYWDAADPSAAMPELTQNQMGHACEWETSMILHLAPHLVVGNIRDVLEVPFGRGFAPGYRAWTMPDRSKPGHIGSPADATADKGDALFATFAHGVSSLLERVIDWNGSTWDA